MKIVSEPRYVSFDNTMFTSKDECIAHEKDLLKKFDDVVQAVKVLNNFCIGRGCERCIFNSDVLIENTRCRLRQTVPHLWHTIFLQPPGYGECD